MERTTKFLSILKSNGVSSMMAKAPTSPQVLAKGAAGRGASAAAAGALGPASMSFAPPPLPTFTTSTFPFFPPVSMMHRAAPTSAPFPGFGTPAGPALHRPGGHAGLPPLVPPLGFAGAVDQPFAALTRFMSMPTSFPPAGSSNAPPPPQPAPSLPHPASARSAAGVAADPMPGLNGNPFTIPFNLLTVRLIDCPV